MDITNNKLLIMVKFNKKLQFLLLNRYYFKDNVTNSISS